MLYPVNIQIKSFKWLSEYQSQTCYVTSLLHSFRYINSTLRNTDIYTKEENVYLCDSVFIRLCPLPLPLACDTGRHCCQPQRRHKANYFNVAEHSTNLFLLCSTATVNIVLPLHRTLHRTVGWLSIVSVVQRNIIKQRSKHTVSGHKRKISADCELRYCSFLPEVYTRVWTQTYVIHS